MTGLVVRAANEEVGDVQVSNPLLQKIHDNTDRSIQVLEFSSNLRFYEESGC
jgi:hypothetical protein